MTTKICKSCSTEFELNSTNFGISKTLKDGFRSYCRKCDSLASKKSREKKLNESSKIESNVSIVNADVYYPMSVVDNNYLSSKANEKLIESTKVDLTSLINKYK